MRLALLGDPVAHSLSPALHRAALQAVGLDGTYEARRVDRDGLLTACAEIREGRLAGANVTMPWKVAAAEACDVPSEEARQIGAVNTLVGRDDALLGENTDVHGIGVALSRLPPGPVAVLGSGATAAAAVVASAGREITVMARRTASAADLVGRLGVEAAVGEWGAPAAGAVVVNTTPLGMHGEPLPDATLDGCLGLVDLPYGEEATPAVVEARRRGLPVIDGVDVLVAQAAASFEIWTGIPAPIAAMERAARESRGPSPES